MSDSGRRRTKAAAATTESPRSCDAGATAATTTTATKTSPCCADACVSLPGDCDQRQRRTTCGETRTRRTERAIKGRRHTMLMMKKTEGEADGRARGERCHDGRARRGTDGRRTTTDGRTKEDASPAANEDPTHPTHDNDDDGNNNNNQRGTDGPTINDATNETNGRPQDDIDDPGENAARREGGRKLTA